MTRAGRLVAAVLAAALAAAACGPRLTDEEREVALRGLAAGGDVPVAADDVEDVVLPDDQGLVGVPADVEEDPAAAGAATVDGPPPAGAAAQGDTPAGGEAGGTQTQAGQPPRDTRPAPPGGNGGATDTGVTGERITIANVADISGPVPGLFRDTQLAVQAYAAMFAATEGTLYGRRLHVLPLDGQMSVGGNRNQYIRACDEAFAAVGSMSAVDDGAAPEVARCNLPDLRTVAVTPTMMTLDQVYGPQPLRTDALRVTEWRFWAERDPQAVQRAAYLFSDVDVTRWYSEHYRRGTQPLGYRWEYVQPIDVAETNYAPFVLEMRRRGIRFVAYQGAYQQAVTLARAMRQQNWWPDVFALQTNAYTPDFVTMGGREVEGVEIAVVSALLEEIDRNPETQQYARWLQQVAPGEQPSSLGAYAWAAARLFVEAAKDAGPHLTREALLDQLRHTGSFDAGGLVAPHHVGNRTPTVCVIIVRVEAGRFRRVEPSQGMRCDADGLVSL